MAKRLLLSMAAICILGSAMALNHGSIIKKNVQLYAQIEGAGPNMTQPITGVTVSFKMVTIGNVGWAWTKLEGAEIMGYDYSSQVRFWDGTNGAGEREKQLKGRTAGTQETYGKIINLPVATNPNRVTILQHSWEWEFRETPFFDYNFTLANSADAGDTQAPVLADPVIANQTATQLTLSLSATDANDVFYYIEDAANGFAEVFFNNQAVLSLTEGTDYAFSIKAIDFSGNESAAKIVNVTGQTFVCNNLLEDKTLTVGTVYFAPNWGQNNNYTAEVDAANDVAIHLTDATYGDWQAQFPIMVATPLAVTPGQTYTLQMDVEVSKNTIFYVKFMDTSDDAFLEITRRTLTAGTNSLSAFDLTCPEALTQITKILFDFGGNPADVNYAISNISVCGEEKVPEGVANMKADAAISVYQADGRIIINSEKELLTANLYTVNGQSVGVKVENKAINTSNLSGGMYILRVVDVQGNTASFKLILK